MAGAAAGAPTVPEVMAALFATDLAVDCTPFVQGITVTSGEPSLVHTATTYGASDFPRDGSTFLMLASGDPFTPAECGDLDVGADSSCQGDLAQVDITFNFPPQSVRSLSFDFDFFSFEFPEFLGSEFNDFVLAFLDGKPLRFGEDYECSASAASGGCLITRDRNGKITNVNNAFFQPCSVIGCDSPFGELGWNVCDDNPDDPSCHDTSDCDDPRTVRGPGCDAGRTGTLTACSPITCPPNPITPGEHTLTLIVSDVSDGIYTTVGLFDNLRCFRDLQCSESTTCPASCDDGDVCTADSCDTDLHCVHTPVTCPAGLTCFPALGCVAATSTPTPTALATHTPTDTPPPTPTDTSTGTPSPTPTDAPTRTPTPAATDTPTPSCAPTGTPYCADECQPCPTARPGCLALTCGECVMNEQCGEGMTRLDCGSSLPCRCPCVTVTPSVTATASPTATPTRRAGFNIFRRSVPPSLRPGALGAADFGPSGSGVGAADPLELIVGSSNEPRVVLLQETAAGDAYTAVDEIAIAAGGGGVGDLAARDMNGDGTADVVASHPDGDEIVAVLGNGQLRLGPLRRVAVAGRPTRVVVADVAGDGLPDVLATTANAVAVLHNTGGGTLAPLDSVPTGTRASDLALGDVRGDGAADLVVALPAENLVRVYLGDGQGGFVAVMDKPANQPTAVALGDFLGDTRLDLAVANAGDRTVAVYRGTGADFAEPPIVTSAVPATRLIPAQFTPDGRLDLVAVNAPAGIAQTRLGNGSGHFDAIKPQWLVDVGDSIGGVEVVDVDGDAKPDLVLSIPSAPELVIAFSNDNGALDEPTPLPVRVACPGDCDEDEKVSISELVIGVNVTVGTRLLSACPALDQDRNTEVTVSELLLAIDSALNGCRGLL